MNIVGATRAVTRRIIRLGGLLMAASIIAVVAPARSSLAATTDATSGVPFGHLDAVTRGGEVRGWAIDPNTTSAIAVDFYVDGTLTKEATADGKRLDVRSVYPSAAVSGFDAFVAMKAGTHVVCAYARNVGPGHNVLVGCQTATIDPSVFGHLDLALDYTPFGVAPQVMVAGWAIDPMISPAWFSPPDPAFLTVTRGVLTVDISIDGTIAKTTTTRWVRDDVNNAYPDFGVYSGFMEVLSTTAGKHTVCALVPRPNGPAVTIGCNTVTIGQG
ncbi:MAG: hypothetical protein QOJ62_1017 [Actinomycetota bacterium]|nr:hypothetical protein [Actinomycetota bacterium]